MRKEIDVGEIGSLVGYHLQRALAFSPNYRGVGKGRRLRQGSIGILSVVAANPGINQTSVANALRIKRANMVALIDDLVEYGLLKRNMTPHDRRVRALTLTAAGRKKLSAILRDIGRLEAKLLAGFSRQERNMLMELLSRVHKLDE